MLNTIVLDACTIINLLRIDEDDGFLVKRLLTMVSPSYCAIAEEVLQEADRNVKRNALDEDRKTFIDQELPYFKSFMKLNSSIQKDEAKWSYVKNASNHRKKLNGELYSAVLSLICSRREGMRSLFFTDDIPAQNEFREIFDMQQIGYIADTAHLLLFIFVNSKEEEFPIKKLKAFLFNLKSEYNRDTKALVRVAENCRKLCTSKSKREYSNALSSLIDGFYRNDISLFEKGLKYVASKTGEFEELDNIITSISAANNLEIVDRITSVLHYVEKNPIFQKYSEGYCKKK